MDTGNTAWLLVCTALVLLMTPGLAFFYGGLVRTHQTVNALVMSFIALGVVPVLWAAVGYSLAFSPTGLDWLALQGVGAEPVSYASGVPHLLFMAFQMTFAIITPALISGAVVGRMKFKAYMVFIALWSLVVYVPLARWVWGGGWLGELGVLDFAGGTVVHISAGVSALVAALVLGPRTASFGTESFTIKIDLAERPHNVPFTVLGAGLLWFGWFGFNAGSALAADGTAALALVNTMLAASAAVIAWILIDMVRENRVSAVGASIAAVVGLVAVTPAAGFVGPMAAILIGATGSAVSYAALQVMKQTGLDDTLDVFACHGLGGVVGALLTGVFAADGSLGMQALGVAVGAAWAALGTFLILTVLRRVMAIRLSPEEEAAIDLVEHGEAAYDLAA